MRRRLAFAALVLAALPAACDTPDAAAAANGAPVDDGPDAAAVDPPASETPAAGPEAPARTSSTAGTDSAATIDLGYTIGKDNAPIAVVEFSDFGCPYCARFARTTMPELRDTYIREGTLRWRYVPVMFGFPGGALMGAAAVCAGKLGGEEAFWRAHDLFYRNQTALRGDDARPRVLEYLGGIGLDPGKVSSCIDDGETAMTLARHNELARSWFVNGTPSFVINGVPMSGALPLEFFQKVFATVLDPSGL